jgi:hypothetical protein
MALPSNIGLNENNTLAYFSELERGKSFFLIFQEKTIKRRLLIWLQLLQRKIL